MFDLNDIDNIESDNGCDELEYYASIQRAINGGMWGLQGSYGRAMMDAIKAGYCVLGKAGVRDYYGNYVPGRDEIEPGFPGSYDFVANVQGVEFADLMASV